TSRAEYRLHLREDNADLRLSETGHDLGLVPISRYAETCRKREAIEKETRRLQSVWASPGNGLGQEIAEKLGFALSRESNMLDLLRRPELDYAKLMQIHALGPAVDNAAVAEQVQIAAKYSGYIERQNQEIVRQRRYEESPIPESFDFGSVHGLSAEVAQKLRDSRPQTVGQAMRISGVTPAAISLLLVHLRRRAA
ncbi:MAG TPA: tRNA uridine-5-carboxymethylaminomethyl(34) synthesis enzyme MnmG, partial [Rudaea sp.]|nr:tRNA uridine-5-carboxymethylaminomethyl(34) synthesis enzyme MnmG [Rudaea sp.]